MGRFKDLNNYYKEHIINKDFPRATLSRWVKHGIVKAEKLPCGEYEYDLDSFIAAVNNPQYKLKLKAAKEKPQNYINTIHNKLLIKSIVPKSEYKEPNYKGTLMYCDCLNCGKKDIQVRFAYLSSNGSFSQESCGCYRKISAFKKTTRPDLSDEFLESFSDFSKFTFIHKCLMNVKNLNILTISLEIYQRYINYFYNDKQFNAVYNFWQNSHFKTETFYDWAKPSIDHIIPLSRCGTSELFNLQFLTVFENLAKRDMTQEEWNTFKKETNTCSNYFIEHIMREEEEARYATI